MRIKADDLTLLYRIHDCLLMYGEKNEVAALNQSIERLEDEQRMERERNRRRAEQNRKSGYVWRSSYHPNKSKYIKE